MATQYPGASSNPPSHIVSLSGIVGVVACWFAFEAASHHNGLSGVNPGSRRLNSINLLNCVLLHSLMRQR